MTFNPVSSHGNGYPLALTGATAATRYVGATASGAPASGTFVVGDFVIDQTGKVYVCTVAGSPGTWTQVGASAITTLSNYITAAVAISANSTFYDGPSIALTAGTWLLTGSVTAQRTGGAGDFIAKLWDGTNTASMGQARAPSAGVGISIAISGLVTTVATPTWKISVATTAQPGSILETTTSDGVANTASYLLAVKLA